MNIDVKDLTEQVTVLGDKIYVYKDMILGAKNFIKELDLIDHGHIEDAEVNCPMGDWVDWTANDNENCLYGKQRTGHFDSKQPLKEMSRGHKKAVSMSNQIKQCAISLQKHYTGSLKITDPSYLPPVYDIKIYHVGADMGSHYDRYPHADNKTVLSGVIYLNDDYEGGELYFENQDIKIKPEAGSVIFFPSTEDFTHSSLIITEGQKECVPLFFYENPS